MAHYLLSVHTSDAPLPADAPAMNETQTQESWQRIQALEARMKDEGAWVASVRLAGSEATTVVRRSGDDVLTTDGPFAESKEHLAGFYIVAADDPDAALAWAAEVTAAVRMPIEVRPFQGFES